MLASQRGSLLARLESTQSQNALLADTVRKQRADIEELLGGLDAAVEDVRAANKALAKGGLVNTLAKEATDVDKELEAVE